MKTLRCGFTTAVLIAVGFATGASAQTARWTEQKANVWYARQPWLVGSNYVPASAINQLEMWQEATFDLVEIDREFGWAEAMGMNTMRVFLHDLLWQQDSVGFRRRIDRFLATASRHHIRPLLVLFDSVWDPLPQLGPQHPPIPGVHNSGWVQSPGAKALADSGQYPGLKAYVQGVVGAFAKDDRVLAWDIWNEPGADNAGSYPRTELRDIASLHSRPAPGVAARGAAARRNTVPSGGGELDPAAHGQAVGNFRAPATLHLHAR